MAVSTRPRNCASPRSPPSCLGIVAVVLGIAFEKENVAYMVMLAFVIAASANFPVLFMSVLWKGCTTKGAVTGGFVGLMTAVTLTIGSASVWEAVMHYPKGSAWFPYNSAAIFSIPAAFITIWLVSLLDRSARGNAGPCRLPGAAGAFRDRHRRVGRVGSLIG